MSSINLSEAINVLDEKISDLRGDIMLLQEEIEGLLAEIDRLEAEE